MAKLFVVFLGVGAVIAVAVFLKLWEWHTYSPSREFYQAFERARVDG